MTDIHTEECDDHPVVAFINHKSSSLTEPQFRRIPTIFDKSTGARKPITRSRIVSTRKGKSSRTRRYSASSDERTHRYNWAKLAAISALCATCDPLVDLWGARPGCLTHHRGYCFSEKGRQTDTHKERERERVCAPFACRPLMNAIHDPRAVAGPVVFQFS